MADGVQHHFFCFSRKAQDNVNNDFQVPGIQVFYGLVEDRERIAPSDESGGFLMDGLEAQFYPDGLLAV